MNHDVKYNSQRNNKDFKSTFPGWKQCFSSASWMLMSFYTNKIDATNDIELSKYFDDVEITVGSKGIGEKIFKGTGSSSFWWTVQQAGITEWLNSKGISGEAVFRDCTMGFYDLKDLLDIAPVIIGTQKLGGLPGGHIILLTGYDDVSIIANDPFGNANTLYKDFNGEKVHYDFKMIMEHVIFKAPDKIRCMYYHKGETT